MAVDVLEAKVARGEVREGVKIIWQGKKIARLVFASGKVVVFKNS